MFRLRTASSIPFAILALATLPVAADAFVVPLSSFCSSASCSSAPAVIPQQMMSNNNNVHEEEQSIGGASKIGLFCALGLAAAVLASGGASAMAVPDLQPVPSAIASSGIQSSTIQLSETIKTMEFSLPSSYDSISDAKSAATEELTVTVNKATGSKAPRAKSSGGSSSKNASAMTSEERAALQAARDAQKEAEAAAKAAARAADKEAAAAAAEAKREATLAVREAEKAEKAAQAKLKKEAAAEKEAIKAASVSSNVDFVDMGLPSYSDSAKTGGKKSPFAL